MKIFEAIGGILASMGIYLTLLCFLYFLGLSVDASVWYIPLIFGISCILILGLLKVVKSLDV